MLKLFTIFKPTSYNNCIMRRVKLYIFVFVLVQILTLTINIQPAFAQEGSASDLINTINQLRASMGLEAYAVDSYLMGFAQSQSNYMASIGRWTHTRSDGSSAFQYGIKENVAMGSNMSVQYCVYTAWADSVHWQTMTGFTTGKIGAGVAVENGIVYYTLNVLPGESEISQPATVSVLAQEVGEQPVYQALLATSTPQPDGSIIHTVQYGETLWEISEAYEVPIEQILTNSNLGLDTTQVYEGQELIIRGPNDPTLTPTITLTPTPITPTPTLPRPTMTPRPTYTPGPTLTPTKPPTVIHKAFGNGFNVGLGLIITSGLGLIALIYIGFIKKN